MPAVVQLFQLMPGKPREHRQSAPAEGVVSATSEQKAAIETQGRALLVDAGAGTGKTWVLVERFIHLLSEHPEWPLESILAVTFTKKAAREMRTRIRAAIEQKVRTYPADTHWQDRRRLVDRLQVSTIHGLCARILKENAIAAGIDPLFTELDEQESDLLKEEAIQQTLVELVDEDSPVLDLLTTIRVRDLRSEMSSLLVKRGTVSRIFDQLPDPATLIERWEEGFAEMKAQLWQAELSSNELFCSALHAIPAIAIRAREDLLARSVEYAQQGCQLQSAGDYAGAISVWLNINLKGGRGVNWGGKEEMTALKASLGALREVAQKIEKRGFTREIDAEDEQAIQALLLWKQLWGRLNQSYGQLKDERRALDFDDLEMLTEQLLSQEPRSQRLRAYLAGINHVMVDEFQDTNQIQQSIIYKLAHPTQGERLFVVGDAKQSIYRFRQAQVSVFNQTKEQIQRASGFPALRLARSFRTHQPLLSFNNVLFDQLLQPLAKDYTDFEAQPGRLTAERDDFPSQPVVPAPVEMILIPNKDQEDTNIDMESARIWEAAEIARRLLSLHAGEFLVWDKGRREYRPFMFNDAAVLMRATTSLPLYEEQFKAAGLPYLAVSGRGYYNLPEVQDLISLLLSLYSPGDDLSLASALRSPLFSLSDETLYRLRWWKADNERSPDPRSYTAALQDPPSTNQGEEVAFAAEVLAALWSLAGRAPVWELLRAAVSKTGYEAALAISDRDSGGMGRRRSNVLKLLEFAREWGGANLSEFLRRVQALKAQEAREGEALGKTPESGAVQLMSIHAAKGLEFPVVVLADLGRRAQQRAFDSRILHDPLYGIVCQLRDDQGDWRKPASYLWAEWLEEQMEQAENKRLLYVACTRAADLLILSGRLGEKGSWLQEILAAMEIEAGGDGERVVDKGRFSIRIVEPRAAPILKSWGGEVYPSQAGITEIPRLAEPLSGEAFPRSISVTQLTRFGQAETAGGMQMFPRLLHPSGDSGQVRAPAYVIGRMVHKALADWGCLSKPPQELHSLLESLARKEGIWKTSTIAEAVESSYRMLSKLTRDALFAEIDAASERFAELPFLLKTEGGVVEGVIDLLYRASDGVWKLIDWKTEYMREDILEQFSREHELQLGWYGRAVKEITGVTPQVYLCYLNPNVRLYPFLMR
ncbi:MAG: UvrD-helicase domain-containing protein [Anaerolineales bacterium]|nr:UvrD-helicase domain-containing protein [Anaerolineales bacterium]